MAAAGLGGGAGAGGDGVVPAATRLQAYAWCREFLAGSWKLIGPEEFGIEPVRYEPQPGDTPCAPRPALLYLSYRFPSDPIYERPCPFPLVALTPLRWCFRCPPDWCLSRRPPAVPVSPSCHPPDR